MHTASSWLMVFRLPCSRGADMSLLRTDTLVVDDEVAVFLEVIDISDSDRKWIARVVTNRDVITFVVVGYYAS